MTSFKFLQKAARDHGWCVDRADPNGPLDRPILRVSRGQVEIRVWFTSDERVRAFALSHPSLAGNWPNATREQILVHLEAPALH